MHDFSLEQYKVLCEALIHKGYQFVTFEKFYEDNLYKSAQKVVVMRHDVDRFPYNALQMASLEKDLNIKATYYFRHIPSVFKKDIIKSIFNLGHEIGYHYETLSKTSGDKKRAISLFQEELNAFRSIVPVSTICMHGSPLSSYDNRDLWKDYKFTDYGILAEPYLSLDYSKITYFTDTARTWGDSSLNFRDKVSTSSLDASQLTNTHSLISYIQAYEPNTLIIQTHPERWAYSLKSFLISYLLDNMANSVKFFISITKQEKKIGQTI